MPRKPVDKPSKREMLTRDGLVTGWDFSMYLRGDAAHGDRIRESRRYLTVKGEFTEPLKGVSTFQCMFHPEPDIQPGSAETPSVGAFVGARPDWQAAVGLSEPEYGNVLLLLATAQLKQLSFTFQQPRYGSALIQSLHLSTEPASSGAA